MSEKKVGRPRGFDVEDVLKKAIKVFWAKGYDGTSMRDLTDAMGVNAPSIYATFGDKKRLFLTAIKTYIKDEDEKLFAPFDDEPDIEKAVTAFLNNSLSYIEDKDAEVLGCFITSCVQSSAGHVDGARELLHKVIANAEDRIEARFDLEKSNGCLPESFPSKERARMLFDLRQANVLRSRAGFTRASVAQDLSYRAEGILKAG